MANSQSVSQNPGTRLAEARESIPELGESLEREQIAGKDGLNHVTQESIEQEQEVKKEEGGDQVNRESQMDVTLGEAKLEEDEPK